MLPAFVIGLREGLETIVVLGAIAVFLRAQNRRDLLGRIWRASGIAVLICLVIALVLRFIEINLGWRQQEQLETVVGAVAVCTVTYMVVWMRRFPKDLGGDPASAAAIALRRDSERALVVLAFLAVLREGFEIVVFVMATIGLSGDNSWLATIGAVAGVLAAITIGAGIVRGSRHVDVARFFRVTAFVLVLSAAGIAMATVHSANAAGWITFGQSPQFDLSWLAPPGSVLSSITTGMFGLEPYPVIIEVIAWLGYFVPMALVVIWPSRRTTTVPVRAVETAPVADDVTDTLVAMPEGSSKKSRLRLHRRPFIVLGIAIVIAGAVTGYFVSSGSTPTTTSSSTTTTRGILYATLNGLSCPTAGQCVAVGDFLPADKDAATGDPDGDGRASHTLAEVFNGRSWQQIASPDQGKGGAVLSSISCSSPTDCYAVGYYKKKPDGLETVSVPPNFPLVESYDGQSWQVVPSPAVAPNSVLSSVSCSSAAMCIAVGATTVNLNSSRYAQHFFVESFNGKSWAMMTAPPPSGLSSSLAAVACPSLSQCIAVGDVAPSNNVTATRPLIEEMDQDVWHQVSLPASAAGAGILYDVSCTAPGQCVAVGNSAALRASGSGLVLRSSGDIWSVDGASVVQAGDATFTSVACVDSTNCVVSGSSSLQLDNAPVKVLARLNGTSWKPTNNVSRSDFVDAVVCLSVSDCIAVGDVAINNFGNTKALIASLSPGGLIFDRSPTPRKLP